MTVMYDDAFTITTLSLFVNSALDQSDVSNKSSDVFKEILQKADLSELAPYFVSNPVSFVCAV